MIIDAKIANQTSKFLLQINAIKLNSKNPFRWASGWKLEEELNEIFKNSYENIKTLF